jgi:ketosteroid isomerase-like protein
MSQENVEIARRAFEALTVHDDIDAFLAFVDPDVEWHSLILEIEGTRHGHDEVRGWWRTIRTTFPDWSPAIVAVRDLGDWVAIHARGTGTGAASGVGVEYDFWQVAAFQDGRMVRYHGARTEAEALEATGLRE